MTTIETFKQPVIMTTEDFMDVKRLAIVCAFAMLMFMQNAIAQTTKFVRASNFERRADGALRLTFSTGKKSCQNPAFSPDGSSILFTRFLNGYNVAGSELVVIDLQITGNEVRALNERVIIPTTDSITNVSVPSTSWIGKKICWASDRAGSAEEVYIADDDGKNIEQLTNHPESQGSFIEPVFNPKNPSLILFEHSPLDENEPHRIALLQRDRANRVTLLTNGTYDDRLPSWSWDGGTLAFQRASPRKDDWQIYTSAIDTSGNQPLLVSLKKMSQPSTHNTDNSWFADNKHILSSSDCFPPIPNIVAFPLDGSAPKRVSNSSAREDGAPSSSPDGKWIAFESHKEENEESPSEIWIILAPQELTAIENFRDATPLSMRITPNPFTTHATIHFSLPEFSRVMLEVFDFFGRKIATLIDEERAQGDYRAVFHSSSKYEGMLTSSHIRSGIYLIQLRAGAQRITHKAFIMK